jgi:hypothetical protein
MRQEAEEGLYPRFLVVQRSIPVFCSSSASSSSSSRFPVPARILNPHAKARSIVQQSSLITHCSSDRPCISVTVYRHEAGLPNIQLSLLRRDAHVHLLEVLVEMVLATEAIFASSTAPAMRTVYIGWIMDCFEVPVQVCRACEL